jgi:hypothetical protein
MEPVMQRVTTTNAISVPPSEGVCDMSSGNTPAASSDTKPTLVHSSKLTVVVNDGKSIVIVKNFCEKAAITFLRIVVTGVVALVDAVNTSDHPQIQSYYRTDPIADDTHPASATK